jgi:hypothetical protein
MIRVLVGSSQVLDVPDSSRGREVEARKLAAAHNGWVQRYEPGTADEPGTWITVSERGGADLPRSRWRLA